MLVYVWTVLPLHSWDRIVVLPESQVPTIRMSGNNYFMLGLQKENDMTVEISEFDCLEVQKIVLSTSLGNAAFLSRPDLAASFAAEQLAAPLPAQIAKIK